MRIAVAHSQMLENRAGKHRDVLGALAHRGHPQFEHVEAVEQVLPECPGGNHRGQILVAGAHDAHIHAVFLAGADLAHAAFLQRAQQLHLHRQRQVRDLIEQQRAAIGGLEEPAALGVGPSKGALTWPKNSASISVSGIAPQFTATNGCAERALIA
jgi:hypothetical protein